LGAAAAAAAGATGGGRGASAAPDPETLARIEAAAAGLPRLHSLILARDGGVLLARAFRGPGLDRPANIKSLSKTLLTSLAGIAIERGVLAGVQQPIAPLLRDRLPRNPDPRLAQVTLGHLLSMRAGLERTSGQNYGRWVSSPDWVRFVLSRPFVEEPGGPMLYSTGSSHLVSAILTRAARRSTLELMRDWLGRPLGIEVPPWPRDPQGIYFGGNDMMLSPRALLRFGEMVRLGGVTPEGRRVLPESWLRASWTPQAPSAFTGDWYGYGWFLREMRGEAVRYGWGYGGQMLFLVPGQRITMVVTSDPMVPRGNDGYIPELHALLAEVIG
jgi:CubicO group peptidase (beta-lactamase class C family)